MRGNILVVKQNEKSSQVNFNGIMNTKQQQQQKCSPVQDSGWISHFFLSLCVLCFVPLYYHCFNVAMGFYDELCEYKVVNSIHIRQFIKNKKMRIFCEVFYVYIHFDVVVGMWMQVNLFLAAVSVFFILFLCHALNKS